MLCGALLIVATPDARATETFVGSATELIGALQRARPGEHIRLEPGEYVLAQSLEPSGSREPGWRRPHATREAADDDDGNRVIVLGTPGSFTRSNPGIAPPPPEWAFQSPPDGAHR